MTAKAEKTTYLYVDKPSDSPHCKHAAACDRSRICEHYERHGVGCSPDVPGTVVRIWDPL